MSDTTKPGIETLRENLFAALEGLKNKTMDVATAKAMSDISQTIINSAKVEIEFQQQHKRLVKSEFFQMPDAFAVANTPTPRTIEAPADGVTKTKHGHVEEVGNSKIHRMA